MNASKLISRIVSCGCWAVVVLCCAGCPHPDAGPHDAIEPSKTTADRWFTLRDKPGSVHAHWAWEKPKPNDDDVTKRQKYTCALAQEGGDEKMLTLSLFTLAIQGRKFPVWIKVASAGFRILKQDEKTGKLVEADKSKSGNYWKIPATGYSGSVFTGGAHPPKKENVLFVEFTGKCDLEVLAQRVIHSPPHSDKGMRPLSGHETAPPPPEGGGQDGDDNDENEP